MDTFFEYLKRKQEKEKFMKDNGVTYVKTVTLPLPEDKWHRCTTCDGTSSYYMEGDLHRSGGTVPCHCSGGLIKSYRKEIYRAKAKSK